MRIQVAILILQAVVAIAYSLSSTAIPKESKWKAVKERSKDAGKAFKALGKEVFGKTDKKATDRPSTSTIKPISATTVAQFTPFKATHKLNHPESTRAIGFKNPLELVQTTVAVHTAHTTHAMKAVQNPMHSSTHSFMGFKHPSDQPKSSSSPMLAVERRAAPFTLPTATTKQVHPTIYVVPGVEHKSQQREPIASAITPRAVAPSKVKVKNQLVVNINYMNSPAEESADSGLKGPSGFEHPSTQPKPANSPMAAVAGRAAPFILPTATMEQVHPTIYAVPGVEQKLQRREPAASAITPPAVAPYKVKVKNNIVINYNGNSPAKAIADPGRKEPSGKFRPTKAALRKVVSISTLIACFVLELLP
ncbi:hypothetical protein AAVH_14487 [Aphelenchoides avenae]|nr:hypothetical protein AAVH_14487 [Aphelenchus avenae]